MLSSTPQPEPAVKQHSQPKTAIPSNEPSPSRADFTASHRVYFCGATNPNPGTGGFGGGCYVVARGDRETTVLCPPPFQGRLGFCTRDMASYLGLIHAMRRAGQDFEGYDLDVIGDSELVVRQMKGECECKDPKLQLLHTVASGIAARFKSLKFHFIPRDQNAEADRLAGEAIRTALHNVPWRNFLNYSPSRAHRCQVKIAGQVTWASTDFGMSAKSDEVMLIDAAFLATLSPDGPLMLRDLVPLCRDSEGNLCMQNLLPGAINVLTAKGGNMNILGVTSAPAPLCLIMRGALFEVHLQSRLVVVLNLPVPLHVTCKARVGDQHVQLFDERHAQRIEAGTMMEDLPAEYRAHSFYTVPFKTR